MEKGRGSRLEQLLWPLELPMQRFSNLSVAEIAVYLGMCSHTPAAHLLS